MGRKIGRERQLSAASAALGAMWCYITLKGAVLAILIYKDSDLKDALTLNVVGITYSVAFIFLFAVSTVLFLLVSRSDPGFVISEEEFTLLRESEERSSPRGSEANAVRSHIAGNEGGGGAESGELRTIDVELGVLPTLSGGSNSGSRPGAEEDCEITEELPSLPVPFDGRGGGHPHGQGDSGSVASIEAERGVRHCDICRCRQPLRTKHCYDCGRCVYTFDHHCFWIGRCVGERNRRLFWWYLSTELMTLLWADSIASSTFQRVSTPTWAQDWFVVNLPNLAALVISIGFTLMLGGVWFFQSYLIATGQTSWEVLRARSVFYLREVPEHVYPFSRGCWGNIANVCLRDSKRRAPDFWEMPGEPYGDAQRFWWIENEYWNCF